MAAVTEKVFFKGTPAQIVAVAIEYESEMWPNFSYEIVHPRTEVGVTVEPSPYQYGTGGARPIDMIRQTTFTTRSVVALHPDSPYVSLNCYDGENTFGVTADLSPEGKTRLKFIASNAEQWSAFLGHVRNNGWLEELTRNGERCTPKHETLSSNRWLAEQYFDRGRTSYSELVGEWLERREREYKPVPSKPTASMRTFINEERKRRA